MTDDYSDSEFEDEDYSYTADNKSNSRGQPIEAVGKPYHSRAKLHVLVHTQTQNL